MSINIDELTVKQVRELSAMLGRDAGASDHPYPVGQNVFIRTVTMYYTGKLVRVYAKELVLVDAAWIPDCGRYHIALMRGELNEVEPVPDGEFIVPRDAIIDVARWNHPLPRSAK